MNKKFTKRPEAPDLWEIYDVETGQIVTLDGFPLDSLASYEADELVKLLFMGEIFPDPWEGG
ncbi:hypothetical protein [Chelativorans salis]|uniref:Uncharacterized protein n=1 Tax=Chelativorans salis TaxID=2978478 RepID=A0ABT2LRZ8_9HYPH|nr:hypothetical protein [Chelativorans sp. EGI FJ00035]MCT7377310.1 hypothetical protein [Chelativorans sp. EGI FJ00035]